MKNLDNNFQFRKDESFGDFLHILREDKKTSGKSILEEDELDIKESRLVISFTTSGEKKYIDSVLDNYKESLFGISPFEDEVVVDGRNSDLSDISTELASRQARYPGITIGESKDKEDKSEEAPQNTKTVEEPEVDPEDLGLEDHDKDDFNKADAKIKPDSNANKDLAIEEVPEDKKQRLDSSKNESTDILWLCNNCDKTFRNTVDECSFCLSNMVERITPVSEGDDVPFDSEDEGDMSPEEIKQETLSAIRSMRNRTNQWAVRDTLKKFTSWGFWKGSEMATINVQIANEIAEELLAYVNQSNDEQIRDVYDDVYHYAAANESKSTKECGDSDMSEELIAVYMKARAAGKSREEAVQSVVKYSGREVDAPTVRNMLLKKGVREAQDWEEESIEEVIINKLGGALGEVDQGYYYQAKRKDPDGLVYEFASSEAPNIEIKVLIPEEE